MRVLQVVHQYPPERLGGTELCTSSLARALAGRGHSVAVFTRSFGAAGGEGAVDGAVEVVRVPGGTARPALRFIAGLHDAACALAFERLLDRFRPDLVHIQHLMGLPIGLLAELGHRGVPFVLSLHDYWWFCPNAQLLRNTDGRLCDGPSALGCARCAAARTGVRAAGLIAPLGAPLMAWRRARMARAAATAALVVAPSRYVLDRHLAEGLAPRRSVVLPHGIEWALPEQVELAPEPQAEWVPRAQPGPAPGTQAEPRRGEETELPPGSRPLRLLYVGGLSPQKGVHVLIEALRAPDLSGGAVLDIVGGAAPGCEAYVADLRRTAAGLPVRFLGQMPHAEAMRALTECQALAMPSVWPETFGMVVSEAFAAGRPVIASRIGALEERVRHGHDGLLVAPGDVGAWRRAIRDLAGDAGLLARLTAGVRPPLSLAEHAAAVERAYGEVLGRGV